MCIRDSSKRAAGPERPCQSERDAGQWSGRARGRARRRRPGPAGRDHRGCPPAGGAVDPLTLALWAIRLAFLAALYLFLALVVRALLRDVRAASGTRPGRPGAAPG